VIEVEEPKDQQVDKKAPPPPPPSPTGGVKRSVPSEKVEAKEATSKPSKEAKLVQPAVAAGSRSESRVRNILIFRNARQHSGTRLTISRSTGEDESDASAYRRTLEGVAERCSIIDNIQRD